jgi:hypothetical protein
MIFQVRLTISPVRENHFYVRVTLTPAPENHF